MDADRARIKVGSVRLALVARTELRDRAWDFGIVDDPSVNAFNLPGGHRYVAFAGADGSPVVLSAHCAHMGTDLSNGCVRARSPRRRSIAHGAI